MLYWHDFFGLGLRFVRNLSSHGLSEFKLDVDVRALRLKELLVLFLIVPGITTVGGFFLSWCACLDENTLASFFGTWLLKITQV